ncbi:hypothetical protein A3844_07565 [Paenibacillus helianthi]|uniref:Uncharacterized protein n=1 Tax=Paenibacillus helianthi TaxID=1349432 RepID=A0ABX3ETZ7_9BACL|nr:MULTISPECIES: hypothetical protein [Paenibacillus]OKP88546.1 hypothetical protein A3844_07565 [Paenibacillus helianthi]OKP89342.1 hypothetical protein A3842_04465 [Paenibacillus sp. P3E]OKP93018.1 hypothetical protein A3848_06490 [Paenibacillus sp. P32E]
MPPPGKGKKTGAKKQPANPNKQIPKGLEYTVAVLLLTGKLRVDSIQMYTDASLFVSLTGKYKSLGDLSSGNANNVDKLLSFLDDNSSLTLNEIMTALKKKTDNS